MVTTKNDEPGQPETNNKEQQVNKETVPIVNEEIKEVETNVIIEKYFAAVPMIPGGEQQFDGIYQLQSLNPFPAAPGIISTDKNIAKDKNNRTAKNNTRRSSTASAFSATLFFSPEFVSANVKDDRPRYREDNRHEIKNSENQRSASSYGVLLNYYTGSKLTLQSGLSVFTRVTDITPKTIYARPNNGGHVNYRISCSAGSAYVPLKSGANPAQGDSTKILSAKNTLQYVSIPLAVKYNIGKGKLNLVPGVGIAANILAKGMVETVIATSGGNENSTNKIEGLKSAYFNSQLSLGAEYQLSKNIALSFTPAAKLALSSINKNAAVKTKLNSFGLSAGITIKL